MVVDLDVTPVGGSAAYHKATGTFTATNNSVVLTFSQTNASQTVLLDDVRVTGKTSSMDGGSICLLDTTDKPAGRGLQHNPGFWCDPVCGTTLDWTTGAVVRVGLC